MKEIKLTQGQFALVDDDDYDYLMQWKWYAVKKPFTYYAVRGEIINGKKIRVYMHKEVIKPPIGLISDHIDHNGLNNQKSNLRICSVKENTRNRVALSKSGYLGVYEKIFHRPYGDYSYINASIKVDGKGIHLGQFTSLIEAALAYDRAASLYFGEFANLNFK